MGIGCLELLKSTSTIDRVLLTNFSKLCIGSRFTGMEVSSSLISEETHPELPFGISI